VCFMDSDHFMRHVLKKGFSHCYVIERQEFIYQIYDPTRNGLNVYMPPCDAGHPLVENMMKLDANMRVLKVTVQIRSEALILKPKPLTCVTVAENIMGVCFGMLRGYTPYGFYKLLMRKKHPNLVSVRELWLEQ